MNHSVGIVALTRAAVQAKSDDDGVLERESSFWEAATRAGAGCHATRPLHNGAVSRIAEPSMASFEPHLFNIKSLSVPIS